MEISRGISLASIEEYRYQAIGVLLESDSDLSYHQSSGDRRKPLSIE